MSRYATLLLAMCIPLTLGFEVARDYSGQTFFDGWNFYGSWDNLTLGDVWWLNKTDAMSQRLAYINDAGRAIMKVDNTSVVPLNEKRNTVRIESQDFFDWGSLWVVDLAHIPFGCSVWPAFWSKGPLWPDDGEIDIIEGINLMSNNQMALHTTAGCLHPAPPVQKGRNQNEDCGTGTGCTVGETAPNSFGPGFAAAGGGVWATQFDVAGIFIWYWSRPDVPQNLVQSTSTSSLDISSWGPPTASYPAGPWCNITKFFSPQQLVFDITLCGDWAGVDSIYDSSCRSSGPTGKCYNDNVVGPGSPKYDNAYFEVNYVRVYNSGQATPTPALPSNPAPPGSAEQNGPTTTITSTKVLGPPSQPANLSPSDSTDKTSDAYMGRPTLPVYSIVAVLALLFYAF
ncbi:concanavalin A-like lectin/glucanase domain-containing protein [Cristinia sonorae]|uniref:Concanavalin A-like lectin/glucanase domain-containing protein n=1 Tax=Cristinia sonorae TaxID=1940300 RepID=A0A8K0ULZ2_9AGAR|nr:concanavalin A-like lectin/glucanase domain-containing protein [Cristinia sonorae]